MHGCHYFYQGQLKRKASGFQKSLKSKTYQVLFKATDRKQYVKEHDVCVDDIVLVPQKKRNKFTTPYRKEKYVVTNVKGSMITAQNAEGHIMTRDASKMKKIGIQRQNDAVNGQDIESDSDEVNKQ